jgi:hypothetical protein
MDPGRWIDVPLEAKVEVSYGAVFRRPQGRNVLVGHVELARQLEVASLSRDNLYEFARRLLNRTIEWERF